MSDEKVVTAAKRVRKLSKDLTTKPGSVIITIAGGKAGAMEFAFNKLPKDVQDKFGVFGYGHKLGDSAAGRSGTDAEKAINKVNEGLLKGDWSVRAPAAPKVNIAEITSNFDKLPPAEKAIAKKFLAGLGLTLPGVTS